jgi:hypothetical protein
MSNVSLNPATRQTKLPDSGDTIAKGLGLTGKAAEVVNQALSLLGNSGIKVTNLATRTDSTGTPTGATGTPVLDNPDDQAAVEANLERLIAFLQLDNDERQAELAQQRIETLKKTLESEHKDRSQKIQKSLDDMDKAAASQKRNRIFGWLMTALAVVAAVVACVATGGLATGAVVAAGIALTCQVLNETGVMDKLTEKLAEGLEKLGLSKEAAKLVAQIAVTVAIIAACVASGCIGNVAGNVAQSVKAVTDVLQPILKVATGVMGGVSLLSGTVGAVQNYQSSMSQADVTETEKYMAMIRKALEESQDELQKILDAIQSLIGQLADLLSSSSETSEEIVSQIGQMA